MTYIGAIVVALQQLQEGCDVTAMKKKLIAAPYLIWMVLFIVAPLLIVVYYAFTDSAGHFSIANILTLGEFMPVFLDSIWLGALASLVCLLIGYPVAYAISCAKPQNQRILIMLIMLPMCMSFLLRTMAWVSLLSDKGLINTFLGQLGIGPLRMIRTPGAVVLGMVYNYLPYMILPLHTVLMKMDDRVLEAASDLGANRFHVFQKVILPLSVPGIITGITMVFVPAVSTFYITKKLGDTSTVMIGDVIETQFKSAYNPNLGAAMSLVLMILVIICMALMNHFTDNNEEAIVV